MCVSMLLPKSDMVLESARGGPLGTLTISTQLYVYEIQWASENPHRAIALPCQRIVRDDARRDLGGVGRSCIHQESCRGSQRGPSGILGGFCITQGGAHDAMDGADGACATASMIKVVHRGYEFPIHSASCGGPDSTVFISLYLRDVELGGNG